MQARIVKKGKTNKKFIDAIKNLGKQSVQVGHFSEQPKHYSGMSYPELLEFWKIGVPTESGVLRQDVRSQFVFDYFTNRAVEKEVRYVSALGNWYSNATTKGATNTLLNSIGKLLQLRYRSEFNVWQGPHMRGTETPLFETGELAENTVFKTSLNSSLQGG